MAGQGWTFAEIWETAAAQLSDAPFAKQGARTMSWAQADRRAEGIATHLLDRRHLHVHLVHARNGWLRL